MLKKAFWLALALTGTVDVVAQELRQEYQELPNLPPAGQLSQADIGRHFLLKRDFIAEPVVFAGFTNQGAAAAFSLNDVPELRQTYAQSMNRCLSKGQGWRLPSLEELRMLSAFVDEPEVDYLPGSYWSSTAAPCGEGCRAPALFKMAYDIRSGNIRNSYTQPIFKYFGVCVHHVQ